MPWLLREGWTGRGSALLAAAVIAVTWPSSMSGGENSAQPGKPSGIVVTVPLEYQETGFQFLFRHVPVERRLVPFPKEPASAHGPVVRGVLKFGSNPSNAIPFVWQGGAKKLFLDLNRNQDLTDDSAGALPATALFSAGTSFIHQMFTNVLLAFPASSAGAPRLVDLELGMDLARRPGEPLFTACLRSYWQGKMTREGQEWQVGLMQNLSDQPGSFQRGELLLRPWVERNQRFIASCEVPMDTLALAWTGKNWMVRASDAFAFSPKVFFEGHACQLDWSAEPRGREESLALRLTEQQTALGGLRITGNFIQRLVLTGGPYMVVLNQPAASVNLPPGRYHPYRVWLKQGKAEAYFDYGMPQSGKANVVEEITGSQMPVLGPPPSEQAVVVEERRTAVLAVGGPLTNSVSAAHRGRNLLLSYRLIGAGGGEYWLEAGRDGKPPQVTIYKSGKKIGSGQFEFG
jgi:phenylpyruvate tautomerase PptA (4-oxalocrotonate tautomerase family)